MSLALADSTPLTPSTRRIVYGDQIVECLTALERPYIHGEGVSSCHAFLDHRMEACAQDHESCSCARTWPAALD